MGAREVLNRLKWGGRDDFDSIKVTILHRGVPNDRRVIEGRDILEVGRGFMRVASPGGPVQIPYHRVIYIEAGGQIKFRKSGF